MEAPEPVIVDWPSLLFAFVVDSLLVWVPAGGAFLLAPGSGVSFAAVLLPAALAVNCSSYARGATLGTYLAGFQVRTRRRKPPGLSNGLILSLLTFASVPSPVALVAICFTPGNSGSGPLGRPDIYPLIGVRTRRRRLLEAADTYWGRWSG